MVYNKLYGKQIQNTTQSGVARGLSEGAGLSPVKRGGTARNLRRDFEKNISKLTKYINERQRSALFFMFPLKNN